MSVKSLVKMANDVGRFFASEPKRADAIAGITHHLRRSWDPRMLRQIIAHLQSGGEGLEDLPREAVQLLQEPAPGVPATLAAAPQYGSTADESTVFEFEKDFAQSLRCIPMSVRLKLDCCGLKVSLKQWSRLEVADRHQLLQQPCDNDPNRAAYRDAVVTMVTARSGQRPDELAVEPQADWQQATRVPDQLLTHMAALHLTPLSVAQWAHLGPVRRFALLKLSRTGHSNENFLPALREFLPGPIGEQLPPPHEAS